MGAQGIEIGRTASLVHPLQKLAIIVVAARGHSGAHDDGVWVGEFNAIMGGFQERHVLFGIGISIPLCVKVGFVPYLVGDGLQASAVLVVDLHEHGQVVTALLEVGEASQWGWNTVVK